MIHFSDALFEGIANVQENTETYYRIEVFNDNDEPQGGLFRGLKVLLDNLWEADDERYDYINEPLSWLEYNTPYPDSLNDPKIKFAYKQNFYNSYLEYFKDIEAELTKLDWSVKAIKLSRPEKVIYEDDVQIAFV